MGLNCLHVCVLNNWLLWCFGSQLLLEINKIELSEYNFCCLLVHFFDSAGLPPAVLKHLCYASCHQIDHLELCICPVLDNG